MPLKKVGVPTIQGTEHQGEGARLTHRYVDGVLTDQPLWPWPMEERIQREMGLSVTREMAKLLRPANPDP